MKAWFMRDTTAAGRGTGKAHGITLLVGKKAFSWQWRKAAEFPPEGVNSSIEDFVKTFSL